MATQKASRGGTFLGSVTGVARAGRNPEMKTTTTGAVVTELSGVVNEVRNGEVDPLWLRFVALGKLGETVAKYISSGDSFAFQGRLQINSYASKKYTDEAGKGAPMTQTSILISDLTLLTNRRAEETETPETAKPVTKKPVATPRAPRTNPVATTDEQPPF